MGIVLKGFNRLPANRRGVRGAGFTLLELLVVLAIAASAAMVVVPQYSKSMINLQLQKNGRQIAATLRQTRNSAITRAQTATFKLDASRRVYISTATERPGVWSEQIGIEIQTTGPDGTGAREDVIVFYPDGSSNGGRVTISTPTRSYRIDVDWLTGRVDIP